MTDWLGGLAVGCCLVVALVPQPTLGQEPAQGSEEASDSIRKIQVQPTNEIGDPLLRNLDELIDGRAPLQANVDPSAVYRLGRMYENEGKVQQALEVWRRGLDSPVVPDSMKVPIADAFLRALDEEKVNKHEKTASRAYQLILAQAGSDLRSPVDSLVKLHVAQLTPILSANAKQSVVRGSTDGSSEMGVLNSDAGEQLRRWWRRHDPLPATETNERMTKHLRRVVYARRHFACENDSCRPAAWDDRGTVYVRFGSPVDRESITYNDMDLNQDVFRFGVPVSASDFPENEVWRYPHIDDSGHYIFAEENGGYQIAETNDLLPHQLQTAYGGRGERTLNKAVSAMAALRHVYKKLALQDNAYAKRYADIDFYASWQEEQAALARMNVLSDSRLQSVGSGASQKRTVGPGPGGDPRLPNEYISDMIREGEVRDQVAARRRSKNMPTEYREEKAPSLPVALRSARFLTEAGSTEVRVAWSHPAQAFSLSEEARSLLANQRVETFDGHLVQLRGVKYDSAYRRSSTSTRKYFVGKKASDQGKRLDIQTLSMSGGEDLFHVRLQWDHTLALRRSGSRIQRGPLAGRAVQRVDSIKALPSDGSSLVMSDLMPGRLPAGEAPRKENIEPYPFSSLGEDAQITLYFELYNLALGDGEKTKYTVEYSVTQAEEDGGIIGLFEDDDRTETQTRFTYQGQSPRTEEFVKLDLEKWDDTEGQPLTIAVRVRDEISGKQAKRTIRFSAPK